MKRTQFNNLLTIINKNDIRPYVSFFAQIIIIIFFFIFLESILIDQLNFGNQKACLIKWNVYTFTWNLFKLF